MGICISKQKKEDFNMKSEHRKFPNTRFFHNTFSDCYSPHTINKKVISCK